MKKIIEKIYFVFQSCKDRVEHIIAGLLTFLVGFPCYFGSWNDVTCTYSLFSGLWATIGSGLMLAACKEWCDNEYSFNKWDWKDFGFTCIGVVLIALFLVGIHFGKG